MSNASRNQKSQTSGFAAATLYLKSICSFYRTSFTIAITT